MSVFYTENVARHWRDVDTYVIRVILYASDLPTEEFKYLIRYLSARLHGKGIVSRVEEYLGKLDEFGNDDFLAPPVFNANDFYDHYLYSIGKRFSEMRKALQLPVERIAYYFDITPEHYERIENGTEKKGIPAHVGLRLKLVFKLDKTAYFISAMGAYQGFYLSRQVQDLRDLAVISMFKGSSKEGRIGIADLASNMFRSRPVL
ncbi:MAG: hypothetical protein COA42_17880 [Alteromonadaceae bacterium]|nr:MAG: hypothetical protein COA42_17880 [Alteromonadaceae bacterium]